MADALIAGKVCHSSGNVATGEAVFLARWRGRREIGIDLDIDFGMPRACATVGENREDDAPQPAGDAAAAPAVSLAARPVPGAS